MLEIQSFYYYHTFIVASLGLILGSFLNVVIHRLPRNKSLIKPPSHCPACKGKIRWFENIPVFSFIFLGGKCGKCKKPISIRYPIVELMTATLFLAAFQRFGWSGLLFTRDFVFMCLMVAITFIDLDHRIIPDELNLLGAIVGLATAYFVPNFGLIDSVLGLAVGFGGFYIMAFLYEKFRGVSGLGGGDIKFLGMLGTFIGPLGVFQTILVSSIVGSVIGIIWAWSSKEKDLMKVAIPFGPFLVLGALYAYLIGDLVPFPFAR